MNNKLKSLIKNSIGGGLTRTIIISLFATLACVGIIKAATTVGNNISTTGTITSSGANTLYGATSIGGALTATSTLSVTGNSIFSTASSTGIVKFGQINSDTGSINFGDENLYTTGNIGIGTSSPYAKLSVVGEIVGSYFTATSTTNTSLFSGNLRIGVGTPSSAQNGGDMYVTDQLEVAGAGERIDSISNSNYIDFNDDVVAGVRISPRIYGNHATLGFRSMSAVTGQILGSYVNPLTIQTAFGFLTPASLETEIAGDLGFVYKGSTISDVGELGEVWKLMPNNGTEFVCTGTVAGACADDDALTYNDSSSEGFIILFWYYHVNNAGENQTLVGKWNNSIGREYLVQVGIDDNLDLWLRDASVPKTCIVTTSSALTIGAWQLVGIVYDGTGGGSADDHVKFYINGSPATMDTSADCSNYVAMEASAQPFEYPISASGTISSDGYLGPLYMVKIPSASYVDISSGGTPTAFNSIMRQLYNAQRFYVGQ